MVIKEWLVVIEANDLLLGWRNPESSINSFSCRSLDLCGFFPNLKAVILY